MGLQALGLRRGGQHHGIAVTAGEEDEQRDGPVRRAQDGPVGGAAALQAGVDDIFRAVRLVGLRNEAAAMVERILDSGRELGKELTGRWRMR